MVERRSREGWVAGLILTVGGILLTLAGTGGPAVWAGLIWSILNGAALAVEAFRQKKAWQYLLLFLNVIIAGSWVVFGEVGMITALPFFFLYAPLGSLLSWPAQERHFWPADGLRPDAPLGFAGKSDF
jgi:hypothetical protein